MGKFHCVESDCATVWVKKREKEEKLIGDAVEFAYNNYFYYAEADSFTYEDDIGQVCYWEDQEHIKQNIIDANENPIPGNYMSSHLPWDCVPTGSYQGGRIDTYPNGRLRSSASRPRYANNGRARLIDYSPNNVVWEGDLTNAHAFLSRYYPEGKGNICDLNVIRDCHISQILTGLECDWLSFEMMERSPPKQYTLTFHNYRGRVYHKAGTSYSPRSPYQTDIFDRNMPVLTGTNRPKYIGLVNPRKITIPAKWEKYELKKLSYLEVVEVVAHAYNFDFQNYFLNGSPERVEIPKHCLNIYRSPTNPSTTPPLFNIFRDKPEFVTQFCSNDPGTLTPPEYYVVCNCDPQCPPGTCAVQCGDRICCYDNDGVAVTSIQIN